MQAAAPPCSRAAATEARGWFRALRRLRLHLLRIWPHYPRGPWWPARPSRGQHRPVHRSDRPAAVRGPRQPWTRCHTGPAAWSPSRRWSRSSHRLARRRRRWRRCGPSVRCPWSSRSGRAPTTLAAPTTTRPSTATPRRRVRTWLRRRRRRRRTCHGWVSPAAPHAAARRCRARHRCVTGRRSAAARPTAAPSSPSRSVTRRQRDRRPPAAPRTGTAASASGRP